MFIAELVKKLKENGIEVVLYTNGDSTVPVEIRYLYEKEEWPITNPVETSLKTMAHCAWGIEDACGAVDLIHVNSAPAVSFARFVDVPLVHTIHHGFAQDLADHYAMHPEVSYVTISDFQRRKLSMPKMRTIHHGIDRSAYELREDKQEYLSFLGRVAPDKGTHLAIEIAKKSGIPLKIAGEVQPAYQEYWETMVKPHVDGRFIEYVGEVGMEEKIELLGNSLAMVFPVQWDEPFGLVMIEAMACGTPVLATPGGSVREVVKEGVSGHVRETAAALAQCARNLKIPAGTVRGYMEEFFSVERMTRDYVNLYSEILRNRVTETEQIVA